MRLAPRPAARPAARVAACVLAMVVAAGCTRVVAPPPPSSAPNESQLAMIAGHPMVVAARAARRLQDMGYTTRRFSSDSLWGWRKTEQVAARMRFVFPNRDSTRVFLEMWAPCRERGCLRLDAMDVLRALEAEDGPPQ